MADAYSSLVTGPNASIFSGGSSLVTGSTTALVASDSVTFFLAVDGVGVRGGPSPTYPDSVTIGATVSVVGTPARLAEMGHRVESKPLAHTTVKMVLDSDPGATLGRPLKTNDLAVWGGLTLYVLGAALPAAGKTVVYAESIA